MRDAVESGQLRTFGFRAFHRVLQELVDVHECSFDDLDKEASVSISGSSIMFKTPMRDLVLLEDTSRRDKNEKPIYEGDRVRARVQNLFGSWEMMEGVVLFDNEKWGFTINFESGSKLPYTGAVDNVEIIGNIFDYGGLGVSTRESETTPPDGETVLPGGS